VTLGPADVCQSTGIAVLIVNHGHANVTEINTSRDINELFVPNAGF